MLQNAGVEKRGEVRMAPLAAISIATEPYVTVPRTFFLWRARMPDEQKSEARIGDRAQLS